MLESKGLIESVGNGSFAVSNFRNPLNNSLKLLLSLPPGRDVFDHGKVVENLAIRVAHHGDTDSNPDHVSALAKVALLHLI